MDWAFYEQYLADTGLSVAEKWQVLEALWSIIITFVDLGFGIEPTQLACGKMNEKSLTKIPLQALNMLD